jgi:hypothetical protein
MAPYYNATFLSKFFGTSQIEELCANVTRHAELAKHLARSG